MLEIKSADYISSSFTSCLWYKLCIHNINKQYNWHKEVAVIIQDILPCQRLHLFTLTELSWTCIFDLNMKKSWIRTLRKHRHTGSSVLLARSEGTFTMQRWLFKFVEWFLFFCWYNINDWLAFYVHVNLDTFLHRYLHWSYCTLSTNNKC